MIFMLERFCYLKSRQDFMHL